MNELKQPVRFLTAKATVKVWDQEAATDPLLSSAMQTASWMPLITDGEPTKLQVTAWLAHEGINNNRLAFRAEDLPAAAEKIAPPNLLPMDWNHSAVTPQYDVPKAIGAWYAAEAKWNPEAKNKQGAMGIEARGVVWSWAFPEQATEMLAMQQANGYVEFSMACVANSSEFLKDEMGRPYELAKEPVFFTLSALNVSAADPDALGQVSLKQLEEARLAFEQTVAEPEAYDVVVEAEAVWATAKSKKEQTDFPKPGENKAVSLRNSQWKLFPVNEAQDLKDNWPEIWRRGGNIRGNDQFRRLAPIARSGGKANTATEEYAVRLREAWVARHYEDFQLAGVVAQVKWLAVGSRGLDHMRSVLNEAKDRVKARRAELNMEEHMTDVTDKAQVALEAALEANAVLKAELEKAQQTVVALESAAAAASAEHALVVARAEEAELKRDALTAELEKVVLEATNLAKELEMAQGQLTQIAAEQAQAEQATRWAQRFAELPESYRAAFAKRSEEEQARFVARWSPASEDGWDEFKSDLMVGFADLKVSYLKLSEEEGKLPTGGEAADLGARLSSLIK